MSDQGLVEFRVYRDAFVIFSILTSPTTPLAGLKFFFLCHDILPQMCCDNQTDRSLLSQTKGSRSHLIFIALTENTRL